MRRRSTTTTGDWWFGMRRETDRAWKMLEEHMDSMHRSSDIPVRTHEPKQALTIHGIIDLLTQAAELPGKGPLATAAMLIALSQRLRRVSQILLIPKTLQEYRMNRALVYRSLVALEKRGLVSVRRHKGCGPLVSLLTPCEHVSGKAER